MAHPAVYIRHTEEESHIHKNSQNRTKVHVLTISFVLYCADLPEDVPKMFWHLLRLNQIRLSRVMCMIRSLH